MQRSAKEKNPCVVISNCHHAETASTTSNSQGSGGFLGLDLNLRDFQQPFTKPGLPCSNDKDRQTGKSCGAGRQFGGKRIRLLQQSKISDSVGNEADCVNTHDKLLMTLWRPVSAVVTSKGVKKRFSCRSNLLSQNHEHCSNLIGITYPDIGCIRILSLQFSRSSKKMICCMYYCLLTAKLHSNATARLLALTNTDLSLPSSCLNRKVEAEKKGQDPSLHINSLQKPWDWFSWYPIRRLIIQCHNAAVLNNHIHDAAIFNNQIWGTRSALQRMGRHVEKIQGLKVESWMEYWVWASTLLWRNHHGDPATREWKKGESSSYGSEDSVGDRRTHVEAAEERWERCRTGAQDRWVGRGLSWRCDREGGER